MATKTETAAPTFDTAAMEDAVTRVRELNERIIASSKAAGLTTLDAYEKALASMLEVETKVAGATQLDWMTTIAQAHADFVKDVSALYTKAARDLLA